MPAELSLLEFVHELLADAGLRGAFADDPRGTLAAYGLGGLSPADVRDALVLAQDNEITDFRPGAEPGSGCGHGAAEPWWAQESHPEPSWSDGWHPEGTDFGGGHPGDDGGWHLT